MKEQVQEIGVKKWYGGDWLSMQTELYAALGALLEDLGSCILSGCQVTDNGNSTYNVSAGIAYLKDSTGANGKFCRVYAQTGVAAASFPIFIVQASRDKTQVPTYGREYKDASIRNVIVEYYGNVLTTQPAHAHFVSITSAGVTTRLRDMLQSASYRFVTDAEKEAWNNKLAASSYTAADVLAKVLTLDGTGSGLDADLLDGKHAADFVLAADAVSAATANKVAKRDAAGALSVTDIIIV